MNPRAIRHGADGRALWRGEGGARLAGNPRGRWQTPERTSEAPRDRVRLCSFRGERAPIVGVILRAIWDRRRFFPPALRNQLAARWPFSKTPGETARRTNFPRGNKRRFLRFVTSICGRRRKYSNRNGSLASAISRPDARPRPWVPATSESGRSYTPARRVRRPIGIGRAWRRSSSSNWECGRRSRQCATYFIGDEICIAPFVVKFSGV